MHATASGQLTMEGTTIDHEGVKGLLQFKGITQFKTDGGIVTATDTSVTISNANTVTIYISIATNFNNYHDLSGNAGARAAGYLSKAVTKPFAAIEKAHIAAYQQYFNRVHLDLGTTTAAALSTDERLKNFDTVNDPQFVALYFQYGRYLLISSSQPGGQPATLQGIWNNQLYPPWDSKYTININAEMNYWPAEKTNLAELHQPFCKWYRRWRSPAHKPQEICMRHAAGWPTTTRISGALQVPWMEPSGAFGTMAAVGQASIFGNIIYTMAIKIPGIHLSCFKNAALFYADFLVEHPKYHWLVVCPDMSPENAPAAHEGSSLDAGVTMTNQIVFDVFPMPFVLRKYYIQMLH